MKNRLLAFFIVMLSTFSVQAQQPESCDIQIEILPDRYMFGILKNTQAADAKDKINVDFMSDVMTVMIVHEGKSYTIEVENENCQAYCKKAKRVRQLHSGDEKLVKNLIKDRKDDIIRQVMRCEST